MIRESMVDSTLNRLSVAFGSRLVIRPPASAEDVATLEQLAGPLPREFAVFLLTCNGLRVQIDAPRCGTEWHLWHSEEMVSSILSTPGPTMPPFLVPFWGDPAMTRDCLVTGHGPVKGAVVRWDPCAQSLDLLASSFGHYLERWTQYVIERFKEYGQGDSSKKAPRFAAEYIGVHDPRISAMRDQKEVVEWLHELDHLVASGDDFE